MQWLISYEPKKLVKVDLINLLLDLISLDIRV